MIWKEFLQWNSPIPYIFGGLAIVFGISSAVLLILACSHQMRIRNSPTNDDKEKASKNKGSEQFDTTPSIAVIMAGDDHPRYMAKPVSFVGN